MITSVTSSQRFTPRHPCPICGGHDRLPRGKGERCYGFLSDDGRWSHCTREEYAGVLPYEATSGTYAHRLVGECNCGKRHDPHPPTSSNGHTPTIEQVYPYCDERGTVLFEVVRFSGKQFKQRQRTGTGSWQWNLKGVKRVPYRLPELLAAPPEQTVYLVEGEKDVDRLRALGLTATTNAGGAGKWRHEYSVYFHGRHVAILPDNDKPGQQHAEQVAHSLVDVAATVRIVTLPSLPPKGDVSDWLAAGGTPDELAMLVQSASKFTNENQANRGNQANQLKTSFTLTRLSDLLAEPPEEIDYVVDGLLIAGGVSILGAKPKVGKSTLARNVALRVAQGLPVLDRGTVKGPVVYLALEEKRSEVAKHFANMGATDEPIFVHVGSAPENALHELAAAIATHTPILAIVDPLLKLIRVRDGNDYAEVSRALEPVLDLARTTNCHLLCVHHLSKGERSGGDAVLGSTALFGAVDTLLLMKRSLEGRRTIETIQRYGEDLPATVVALDPDTGSITAGGDVAVLKLADTKSAVLQALGDETLSEAEIRERVGGNESWTAKALRELVGEVMVLRSGSGRRGDPYHYTVAAVKDA